MSFTNINSVSFLLGVLALAIMLYFLQRLRIRYRTVKVANASLWKKAVEDNSARALSKAFRHWLSFLLTLLICLLLWAIFAEPKFTSSENSTRKLLFLDASAQMAVGDSFENAIVQLERDLHTLSSDEREVFLGGKYNVQLLARGESSKLLQDRLSGIQVEATPSKLDQFVTAVFNSEQDSKTHLIIYGNASVSKSLLENLPENIEISHAFAPDFTERFNVGITSFGYQIPPINTGNVVDIYLSVEGTEPVLLSLDDLSFSLDGRPYQSTQYRKLSDSSILFQNVPATGGILKAKLIKGDSLSLDDQASLALPNNIVINVAISTNAPKRVFDVVNADPKLRISELQDADVVVRSQEEEFGQALPALIFFSNNAPSIEFDYVAATEAQNAKAEFVKGFSLNEIQTVIKALDANTVLDVKASKAKTRALRVWESFAQNEGDFVDTPLFPMLIARAIRWLSGPEIIVPYVEVGANVHDFSDNYGEFSLNNFSLNGTHGNQYVASFGAFDYKTSTLQSSLTNKSVSLLMRSNTTELESTVTEITPWSWYLFILFCLCALLLLQVEWQLFQRGLLP